MDIDVGNNKKILNKSDPSRLNQIYFIFYYDLNIGKVIISEVMLKYSCLGTRDLVLRCFEPHFRKFDEYFEELGTNMGATD